MQDEGPAQWSLAQAVNEKIAQKGIGIRSKVVYNFNHYALNNRDNIN